MVISRSAKNNMFYGIQKFVRKIGLKYYFA